MSPTSVLIVEDDLPMQTLLRKLVSHMPGFAVVAISSDGVSAVQSAAACKPSLVLIDIGLPEMDGIAATQSIRRALPNCRVVVVTTEESAGSVLEAISAGANGYCTRTSVVTLLQEAIRCVMNGTTWIDPRLGPKFLAATPRCTERQLRVYSKLGLEPIECEILHLIALSQHDEDICSALSLSAEQPALHIQSILTKLAVSNRDEAATLAIQAYLNKDGA